jgi:hypothetical protein
MIRRAGPLSDADRVAPIRDIRIEGCAFSDVARPDVVEHVEGLKLTKVTVNGKAVTVS